VEASKARTQRHLLTSKLEPLWERVLEANCSLSSATHDGLRTVDVEVAAGKAAVTDTNMEALRQAAAFGVEGKVTNLLHRGPREATSGPDALGPDFEAFHFPAVL